LTQPRISLIAAVSRNGVIGRDGDMPWKLSTDLKRFKALTLGKPVIVGRKTFDSFGGRPLPGRPHVIVTRNPDFRYDGADVASSLSEAIEIARAKASELDTNEIYVLGGGQIYAEAIRIADTLYITHVDAEIPDGDTVFPAIDPTVFDKTEELAVPAGEKDSYATRFATYVRQGVRRTAAN